MKNIIVLLFLSTMSTMAQVGIGTETPNATLEIKSTNEATPSNNDGLLIPKVEEFPVTNPAAAQDGMLVYATGAGSVSKGFYYWDDATTAWVQATGAKNINDLNDGLSDSTGSSIYLGIDAGIQEDLLYRRNIGIGLSSMENTISGYQNVAVGMESLNTNTSGFQNVAIGAEALKFNTTAFRNNALGSRALYSNTTGDNNAAFGSFSLSNNTTGRLNTAMGNSVLINNSLGNLNTGVGFSSLQNNTTGGSNVALGSSSLYDNTVGTGNTSLGTNSLENLIDGNGNVAVGVYSGNNVENGDSNTFLGAYAAGNNSAIAITGSIFIGYSAGTSETFNNRLYIENSSSSTPLIYGEFDNDIVGINGSLGVGTQAPGAPLHVEEEGVSGVQTIVAAIASNASNRPVLQFSETANVGLAEGMSLEYNGTGSGAANRMVFNDVGGNPLFEFRNGGDLTLRNGDLIVRGAATDREIKIEDDAGNPDRVLMRQTGTQDIYVGDIDNNGGDTYVRAGGSTELSIISGTGFVGINTLTPAWTFEVNGNAAKPGGGSWINSSDRRLKQHINQYADGLEQLLQIEPVTYHYNSLSGFDTSKQYIGVIAQDLNKVAPYMVQNYQRDGSEYMAVDNSAMTYMLINAVKTQQAEIELLKEALSEIKTLLKSNE